MSKAVVGDPAFDSEGVRRFVGVRDLAAECVSEFLGSESALANLSQGTGDEIETTLRETRIEIDKGLLVFAKRRTIRTLQGSRSVVAPLARRLTDLEDVVEALQAPEPKAEPKAEPEPAVEVAAAEVADGEANPEASAESEEEAFV
jgi:hypothetical protein